ncbi:MAG: ATP-binding protein [Methanosphaera sp.]|nr:ATP-binding protein [Methanosphaera sp.]
MKQSPSYIPLYIPKDIDKYFYNRKKDIKKINNYLNILQDDISEQLLITGYRCVGKTFLLRKIMKDLNPDFLTCYLDISKVYSQNKGQLDEEKILLELLNLMNLAVLNIKEKNIEKITETTKNLFNSLKLKKYDFNDAATILNIPIANVDNNYEKLSKFVMEYPQKIVEQSNHIKGFVIIIDEFQYLNNLDNPESFFWLIRSHTQFQDNVSYIFTGSTSRLSEIVRMINGEEGAFSGRMIQINVDPFSKEETKSYFDERLSNIHFTDDGFEKFYHYTRGIPAYINSFYNIMDSNMEYNAELVEKTFFENMDQILVMWIKIWGTLHKTEKEIITVLVENDTLTWTELMKKIDFSEPTLTKYLTYLQNKGLVLYHNKEYYVEDEMLINWLKNEKKIRGFYPI